MASLPYWKVYLRQVSGNHGNRRDLHDTLGNLYGFSAAVLEGVSTSQVSGNHGNQVTDALELHDTLGNLYGFSAVMEGLSTSQLIGNHGNR